MVEPKKLIDDDGFFDDVMKIHPWLVQHLGPILGNIVTAALILIGVVVLVGLPLLALLIRR